MNGLIEKMNDGGPVFTYVILMALLAIIVLFVRAIIQKGDNYKTIELIKQISWFAIAWGFLGRVFGLIGIFDKVQIAGDIAPSVMAHGLKMALVSPLTGMLVFALARLALIILVAAQKNFHPQEDK
jgi:hypothetical protein